MEFLDLVQEQDEKIQKLLLELPALITLYGVNHDGKINKREKEAVAHLLRVDTYNSDAFLQSYYKQVEGQFMADIERYDESLSLDEDERESTIKEMIAPAMQFVNGLRKDRVKLVKDSLMGFVKHVHRANTSFWEEIVLPFISDYINEESEMDDPFGE